MSQYKSSTSNNHVNVNLRDARNNNHTEATSRERQSVGIDSQGSDGKLGLPKNTSLDELSGHSGNVSANKGQTTSVNPPAIIFNTGQLVKNKSFSNGMDICNTNNTSSLNATKATLVKMIQEKGINSSNQTSGYTTEQPGIMSHQ